LRYDGALEAPLDGAAMTEFIAGYGLFLLKAITIVAAVVAIIATAAAAGRKASGRHEGLEVESLNKKYRSLVANLRKVILSKNDWKASAKAEKARVKAETRAGKRARTFVIDFKGDLKATAVASLREEVSAILAVAGEGDQVVARIENFGGVVHEHGLAASQLARLRDRNIPLTVTVDKVAASGGYLMACVADRIVAAPFAILGSIGVIAQLPNFNRLLDNHGIDFEQITAGEYKRTVTMFGRNTDEDRAKLKKELDDVHELFKAVVAKYRPQLELAKVATGEYWYGTRALELGLADEIGTSDELLAELTRERDVYSVCYRIKQPLPKKLLAQVDGVLETADASGWRRRFESRLPR
jgi:serine protease SohB